VGLIAGVELVRDRATNEPFDVSQGIAKRLHQLLLDEGLICRPIFNALAFAPPLIVTKRDVDGIVSMFVKGLVKLTEELSTVSRTA
jgi:L-2,4-diaminobutyrate transaminase